MYKHALKRVFVVLFGLLLSIALLSGCDLFNQKPITITKVNNVSLQVDDTKNITVTTTPGDVIIKAVSNNTSIATVLVNKNILTIKGKAEGEAEITITATKSGYKTASLKFKVIVSKLPVKPNIESVSSLADIEVAYRTLFENIGLPDEVEVTLDDQNKQTLEVEWDEGNYNGNSTGTYNLEGNLILVEGITNNNQLKAKINVIVPVAAKGDVKSVEQLAAKKVPYEVEFADLDLPKQVKVILDEGSEICLDVEWDSGNYDGTLEGEVYTLEGTLVLCSGVTNTLNLSVTIDITVNTPPIITKMTPEEKVVLRKSESVDMFVSAEDSDGDLLTYLWKIDGSMIYGEYTNSLTYDFDDVGTFNISVEVFDGLDIAKEDRTVEVNCYPNITSLTSSETIIKIGEEITLKAIAVDNEEDVLSYRWELNQAAIDKETDSSMKWTATELGTCYFRIYVSDDGWESSVYKEIEVTVVEEYIPEIKTITGPEEVVVTQTGIKFTAEYGHRDPNKELTVHWKADDGIIVKGQDTGEIEWDAPSGENYSCTLTFFVSDGVIEISKDISVHVKEPFMDIEFECNDTVAVNEEYNISLNYFNTPFYQDAQISATTTGGKLEEKSNEYNNVRYIWTTPEKSGTVTLTFDAIVNGVKFSEVKEFMVVANDIPVINDVLVNQSLIDVDQLLILEANELYNFEVQVDDEDELDIQWVFEPFQCTEEQYFSGSAVEYPSNEIGLTTCYIAVDDGINPVVNVEISIFVEDDSIDEIADQAKIDTIEMISDEIALAYVEKDIELLLNQTHPEKIELFREMYKDISDNEVDIMERIDRYLITFDSSLSIYSTYILYRYEIDAIIEKEVFPLFFKEDSNGRIKLYGLWSY